MATGLRAPEPVRVEAIGDLKEQLEAVAVAGGNKRKSFVVEKGVEESWDEVKRVTASTMKQFSVEFDWTFSLSRFDNSYENEHVGAYVFGSVGAVFGGIMGAVFGGMAFWTASGIKRASDSGYRKCARAYYNFYLTLVGASACIDDGTCDASVVNPPLTNLFKVQLRLGMFDSAASQPYTKLGMESDSTPAHQALALEAAQQYAIR